MIVINKESIKLSKDLYLEITMTGTEFDGMLNFGAVEMQNESGRYLLDITDTYGNRETETDSYTLISFFQSDSDEILNLLEDSDYTADFDLPKALTDGVTKFTTDLTVGDEDNAPNASRVTSVKLKKKSDDSFSLEVKVED